MMKRHRRLRTVLQSFAALIALVLIVAYMSGLFKRKTSPGRVPAAATPAVSRTFDVELRQIPNVVRAVGTMRAVRETAVGSRILAPIAHMHILAGQRVEAGDVLVELDKADIEARRRQREADLEAARSRAAKAANDFERISDAFAKGAATRTELYDTQRAQEVAVAEAERASQLLEEATTQLSYATIRSPLSGIVIDKQMEEGDLARPGDTLVKLYDPEQLQLEAAVPERLALQLKVGDTVDVEIPAISRRLPARISEIVPQASPSSRSLLVKVTADYPPGVVSGMFGRLLITEGEKSQILVPRGSVRRVGQLEMVKVVGEDGRPDRRFVRTGEVVDDLVEILAGLQAGERVSLQFDGAALDSSTAAQND